MRARHSPQRGRYPTAQGNALGNDTTPIMTALKGRNKDFFRGWKVITDPANPNHIFMEPAAGLDIPTRVMSFAMIAFTTATP